MRNLSKKPFAISLNTSRRKLIAILVMVSWLGCGLLETNSTTTSADEQATDIHYEIGLDNVVRIFGMKDLESKEYVTAFMGVIPGSGMSTIITTADGVRQLRADNIKRICILSNAGPTQPVCIAKDPARLHALYEDRVRPYDGGYLGTNAGSDLRDIGFIVWDQPFDKIEFGTPDNSQKLGLIDFELPDFPCIANAIPDNAARDLGASLGAMTNTVIGKSFTDFIVGVHSGSVPALADSIPAAGKLLPTRDIHPIWSMIQRRESRKASWGHVVNWLYTVPVTLEDKPVLGSALDLAIETYAAPFMSSIQNLPFSSSDPAKATLPQMTLLKSEDYGAPLFVQDKSSTTPRFLLLGIASGAICEQLVDLSVPGQTQYKQSRRESSFVVDPPRELCTRAMQNQYDAGEGGVLFGRETKDFCDEVVREFYPAPRDPNTPPDDTSYPEYTEQMQEEHKKTWGSLACNYTFTTTHRDTWWPVANYPSLAGDICNRLYEYETALGNADIKPKPCNERFDSSRWYCQGVPR